ncbi:MAG: alpha/beta hydrolase [Rickettsiales bacterium]|nr:MAG: alpha/beta hydrolase [Rickettsiales bacterium]
MKKTIALLGLLILSACTHRQEPPITLPNTEIRLITSKENNVAYKLFVSLPEGYDTKGHPSYQENYPVLYLLDPDVEFGMAENIARTMVNYDTIRPFIIVGIGYQNQDLTTMNSKEFWDQWTKNRARDYIPIQVQQGKEDFESGDHEYKGLSQLTGGSSKFKDFIETELIHYINQTYRTSNERALVGHSQAGLFTTWMMLEHPDIFKKYIILSPSLWVEKGRILKQSSKLQNSNKITAYFAAGSMEHDGRGSMVNDLKTFYDSLPKDQGFKSKLEIIEDENHVSMVPIALTKGLKYLFGK